MRPKRVPYTKQPLVPLLVGIAASSEFAHSARFLLREKPDSGDLPASFVSPSSLRADSRFSKPEIEQALSEFKASFRAGPADPTPCTELICNPYREDYKAADAVIAQCARCRLWYHLRVPVLRRGH